MYGCMSIQGFHKDPHTFCGAGRIMEGLGVERREGHETRNPV